MRTGILAKGEGIMIVAIIAFILFALMSVAGILHDLGMDNDGGQR